ncbi:MAG TPA: hypothetical protein VFP80_14740 [Thermoanaerobaculia bacterium]|nr:hypothetical protein [Thermoanaerobaculia bacterium]
MSPRLPFLLLAALALPAFAASRYHLELEANPAAAFPYLSKFGSSIEVHVYPAGVRVEALWLNGFSRNGAPAVTVANPLGRMYVDVPVAEIAPTLRKLAGDDAGVEKIAVPVRGPAVKGKVHGIDATRHRLVYGPQAWVDIWTTDSIPQNPQLKRIADQLYAGISPGTAQLARTIPGTPLHVELNFRRFQKVPLLKVKQLDFDVSAEDEQDALELGPIYVRAPLLERLFQR